MVPLAETDLYFSSRHMGYFMMAYYCLSQVTNDQKGTVHKHIKPLKTAHNNWLSCF